MQCIILSCDQIADEIKKKIIKKERHIFGASKSRNTNDSPARLTKPIYSNTRTDGYVIEINFRDYVCALKNYETQTTNIKKPCP